jgi:hypothetical protein
VLHLVHKRGLKKGEAALDWWSLVHVAAGMGLGLLPIGWLWAVLLIVGFEGVEALLRRVKRHGNGLFEHESWPNIAADVVVGLLGFAAVHHTVGQLLPWPWEL